jgi:hypothetical protein
VILFLAAGVGMGAGDDGDPDAITGWQLLLGVGR